MFSVVYISLLQVFIYFILKTEQGEDSQGGRFSWDGSEVSSTGVFEETR